jgi:predicted ATPase
VLTSLRFRNFKIWKDSGDLRLAPLTVLFGGNSAGKSAISQLLVLLKQTAASSDRRRVLHLGGPNSLVDLGTYEDIIYGHDTTRPLGFEATWDFGYKVLEQDPVTGAKFSGESMNFCVELIADKQRQPVVEGFRYSLRDDSGVTMSASMNREPNGKYDLSTTEYIIKRHTGRPWQLQAPAHFYAFPEEALAKFQNTFFTYDFAFELERLFGSIYYVGPLREYPQRLYLWSGEAPADVGMKGDQAVNAILAAANGTRRFNFGHKQATKRLDVVVAEQLHEMGLIESFDVHQIVEHRNEYEVLVQVSRRQPQVKLTDVGFGVGQVLPVVVECFYVPKRSIVIFEQPEIHLHPRAQAGLADLFVNAVLAREDAEARNCQFIVESHSEHFLRRLQLRIAEEKLSREQTAMYFVTARAGAAEVQELDIDAYGNIQNWPQDFFGDEMGDLVARAEAQAQRTKMD